MERKGVNCKLAFSPPSRILFFSSNSAGLEVNLKISSYLASDQVIFWIFIIFVECLLRGFFSLLYLCLLFRKVPKSRSLGFSWISQVTFFSQAHFCLCSPSHQGFYDVIKVIHFIMYVYFIMASFGFWVTDLSWFSSFLTSSPFWSPSHLSPLAVCSSYVIISIPMLTTYTCVSTICISSVRSRLEYQRPTWHHNISSIKCCKLDLFTTKLLLFQYPWNCSSCRFYHINKRYYHLTCFSVLKPESIYWDSNRILIKDLKAWLRCELCCLLVVDLSIFLISLSLSLSPMKWGRWKHLIRLLWELKNAGW